MREDYSSSDVGEKKSVNYSQIITLRRSIKTFTLAFLGLLLLVLFSFWQAVRLNATTANFPIYQAIEIEEGMNVKNIAKTLKEQGVVKSDLLLYYTLIIFHEPTDIKASVYMFEKPLTTLEVAKRLTEGDFDTNLLRITHFEGERVSVLAERVADKLPNFKADEFIAAATQYEGRLFPDTYFIPETYTNEEFLNLLLETFNKKVVWQLEKQIESHSLSLDEILVLASIIEREANTLESKRMVSGILQNRLAINMPLQADASIEYVLEKPLDELTPADLESESPYNTYLNVGLPPTPIGNPGLEAITAVLEPTPSDFFYYITDTTGEFHYAETYTQHLRNIESYLR